VSEHRYRDFAPTFADRSTWTLPWILRHRAESHGDRTYLEVPSQGVKMTFAETLGAAERIAAGFLRDGNEPGDRVLIMSPNRAEVILGWFGSSLAGLVEVPINTAYAGSFLEHQVRTTAPRSALVHSSLVDRFEGGSEAFASIETFYVIGDGEEEIAQALATLSRAGLVGRRFGELADEPSQPLPEPLSRDLSAIFFTSGTTGLSKGVAMSHSQMTFFADEGVSLTRLTEDDTYMSVGPLFHGNAQFLAAYPALIVGARFVLRERYSASRWIDQIRECGATVTNFVGVMMDWTWKQPERADDADNQLRCIWSVPTATSIAERFQRRFGVEAFVENFGLTETCMPIMTPYNEERPAGAAGLLVDEYFEVRLVDPDTDEEVAVGEVGELVVRAKLPWTMCSGYYGMPDRTAEAQRNLWFHTGDGLKRDADGWYYFVDRLKDAIRRRGENISSYEVEQAVLAHEEIADCAVVAAPTEAEAGEDEVAVFVVLESPSRLGLEEVRDWCAQRLPAFALPEYVAILAELPATPSGKIRKIELRQLAAEMAVEAQGTQIRAS
jgi:crotonobetaine/carnitine-CoA ligase